MPARTGVAAACASSRTTHARSSSCSPRASGPPTKDAATWDGGSSGARLVPTIVAQMSAHDEYGYLVKEEPAIAAAIQEEESRFAETLEQGVARFEETAAGLERRKESVFPGAVAFQLYDTYGFPFDL